MDIRLIDNGNGGDAIFTGSDLSMIEGWQNMPYLGIVGGDLESNTIDFKPTEQRFDWWGNDLLMPNDSAIQFNSDFERALNNLPINSASRLKIEQIVKSDLKFMESFSSVKVNVSIVGVDRYSIYVTVSELGNLESNEFIYLWDATQNELIVQ